MNGWYARSDSTGRIYERTQTPFYSSVTPERDRPKFSSSRSQWITERSTTSARLFVSKKLMFAFSFLRFVFSVRFVAKRYIEQVSEGTNRNLSVRNRVVQLLALYTNPESHNAQCHRQTDRRHDYDNSRSYCAAVRSAKNGKMTYGTLVRLLMMSNELALLSTSSLTEMLSRYCFRRALSCWFCDATIDLSFSTATLSNSALL